MIIDAHHHLLNTPGYLETLVAECRRLGIVKVCLFGGGRFSADFGLAGDEQVLAAGQAYPDLILPFTCFDLGVQSPERINAIGAHLGNPWYEEAAMALRWNQNLYADLSGSTMKCKPPEFLGGLLWWTPTTRYRDPLGRHAWEKIVFGSDVPAAEIEDVLNDYKRTMAALNLAQELQSKVLHGTMARILWLNGCSGDEQGAVAKTKRRDEI